MNRRKRPAFTLVELLVVIVILGLLVSLLVPAVMRAVKTAKVAAAAAEIRTLSQAMADFKAKYNSYPPSRIVIAEDGDYSDANLKLIVDTDGTYPGLLLRARSMTYLRKFWPRLQLRTDGTTPSIPDGGWYDVNGDHNLNPPYIVFGDECLALFIGGVPEHTKDTSGVSGFGKNPLNPFTSAQQPPPLPAKQWPFSANRTAPMHQGKVVRTTGGKVAFVDSFGLDRTYAYFSAYEGVGYDPDDVNIPENDEDTGLPNILGGVQSTNAATPKGNTSIRPDVMASPAPNPYTNDSPMPIDDSGNYLVTERRKRLYFMDNTFQIISAGVDGQYGIGGEYNPQGVKPLPFHPLANKAITGQTLTEAVRLREKDNVTNFASSSLD